MENNEIYKQLYPNRSITSVIGNLCNNPDLLRVPDKKITSDDFYKEIHKIIFDSINNLVYGSLEREEITAIDIDNFLSEYPEAYKVWETSEGFNFITQCKQFAKEDNYTLDYDRVKKFSLLRAAVDKGMSVTHFYDVTNNNVMEIDQQMKKLDELTLNDMLDYFTKEMISLRDSFGETNSANTYKAGANTEALIYKTNESPSYGYPFRNRFYNTLTRGMHLGKLMLRSADSGTGKTRLALNDLINVSMTHLWNKQTHSFEYIGEAYPSLYIGTEEESDEIDLIVLATVSGIPQDVIQDGNFNPEVMDRLLKANEIIQNGRLYIHRDDDFSITDIEMVIERFIMDYQVQYVAFDYVQLTPKITRSALDMFGLQLREDLIISSFVDRLKDIAQTYKIFMITAVQHSRNSADKSQRNGNCLAGGRATQNKADMGVQIYRVDSEDLQKLEPILQTGQYEQPNYSHWWYKNRGGVYTDCIVWTKMDLGTMQEKELFITDNNYNLLEVDLTEINFEDNEFEKKETEKAKHGFEVPTFN